MDMLDTNIQAMGYQMELSKTLNNKKIIAMNFTIEILSDKRDELKKKVEVLEEEVKLLQDMIDVIYEKRDSLIENK